MIALGLFAFAVALIAMSGRLLADTPNRAPESKPRDGSAWFDAALFLLLLFGTYRAHKRKRDDDDTSL